MRVAPVAFGNVSQPATRSSRWSWGFTWLIVAASWMLTIARAIPVRDGDRGVFVSMAERIAAGDTLYVDVWDNKEPFFFHTLALGRLIAPQMDVVIELGWLAVCAWAVFSILGTLAVDRRLRLVAGWGMTPVIITGTIYAAGFSHLPPTALFLATTALLVRGRFGWAAAVAMLIPFFKVIMLPMALVIVGIALLRSDERRTAAQRTLIGGALSLAASFGILAVRGELVGYLKLLWSNVSYSQSSTTSAVLGPYQWPIWAHLEPVFTTPAVAVTATIILVLALTRGRSERTLWLMTAWSGAAAVAVIAITGLWPHHGQILYGPAVLALALVAAALVDGFSTKALIVVLAATVLLSGAPNLRDTIDAGLSAPTRWRDLSRIAQPTQDLLAIADSGVYHRLGKNTDDAHAQGLRDFTLGCYQFVQYTYDLQSTLDYIPSCLPSVEYLIVDKGFVPQDGADAWNRFVEQSEAVLAADFTCEARDWGRLCVNTAS